MTDTEINELIDYYDNLHLTSIPKKARREYIDKVNQLKELKKIRDVKTAPNKCICQLGAIGKFEVFVS